MKEFVEKLIGMLEEKAEEHKKYWQEFGDECSFGGMNATLKAIDIANQLAEEYNNGWIPCSERLPEDTYAYLVTIDGSSIATILSYDEVFSEFSDDECNIYTVTAWQPLPEPYQKGE